MGKRRYEELTVGERFETGTRTIHADEIVDFAEKYDPQPFHVDETSACDSMFGELVASGLQTLSVCNRLATERIYSNLEIMGGRGIDELRFHDPVYAGDTLSVSAAVTGKRPSRSHADRGYVDVELEGFDGCGTRKISWTALTIVKRVEANR